MYSDNIKQLFDLKESQGEDLNKWAQIGVLYKRAVDLLAHNKLPYLSPPNPTTPLHGQEKVAQAIKKWVNHQIYLNIVKTDNLKLDQKYHCAMEGFLYKEAVDKLSKGHFKVLGAKEVAKSIQEWVETELVKRCNFHSN